MLIDLVKFCELAIGDKFKYLPLQPQNIHNLGFLLEGETEVEDRKLTFEEQIAAFKAGLKKPKKKKEVYKQTDNVYQKISESKYIGKTMFEGKPVEYDMLYPKHYYVIKL